MNINILRYSLFGIAGGQEIDLNFSYIVWNVGCGDFGTRYVLFWGRKTY